MGGNEISDEYDWLKKEIKRLVEIAEPVKEIYPKTFYHVGGWSLVKLLAFRRFVEIYTKIIGAEKQKKFFKNMFYIDLMSGSGLCRVRKTKDIVAGSTIIACVEAYHPFNKHFIVEQDPKKASALEERVKHFTNDYKLFNCDCNDCIEEILAQIPEKSHYLAFVDCLGMDVPWSTMKKIFSKNGDVLINFQTSLLWRQPNIVKKQSRGWKKTKNNLNNFFGDSRWTEARESKDLLDAYIEKIKTETSRNLVISLPVIGEGSYRYDIILATRLTKNGSPWIKSMQELEERMGGYKPAFIQSILDYLMHRQTSVIDFCN
ncbi:MAG: three-Cys-motif partner protein TcmP [Candidatus Bathyarchaeota archaeon]|nr:three-Cys-motif partner protein TcmP [Candidatus Bathyarchaeum tardum]